MSEGERQEIAAQCRRNLAAHGDDAHVVLVVPRRPRPPCREFMRIAGRAGPKGRVVGESQAGTGTVLDCRAAEVLAWLERAA